ncbi:hypothetical protein DXG01_004156 [Tephrocybe rancida]|nr:hypothetical protein DXG01_004156 [Tephrocybe rancida]
MPTTAGRYRQLYVNIHMLRQYKAEEDELEGHELELWRSAKRAARDAQLKHAKRCEQWNQTQSENRSNELEDIRQQRLEAIKGKLTELGWEQEIAFMEDYNPEFEEPPLSEHKLVRQPKALTERIWNNIKDPLVELMERARAARHEVAFSATIKKRGELLSEVLKTYASSQPLHTILPSLADVAIMPLFKTIIQGTPAAEGVTVPHFQLAMANFSEAVAKWRQSKDESLVHSINRDPRNKVPATLTTLQDGTTVFLCLRCREYISYPRVLIHRCATAIAWCDMIKDRYLQSLGCKPWNYKDAVLRYNPEASANARSILRDCSLGGGLIDHDMGDLRFECLKCASPRDGRLLMKWPIVVEHVTGRCKNKDAEGDVQVAQLSLAEQTLAELLEYGKMDPVLGHWCHSYSWVCLECKRVVPWSESLKHLKEKHPNLIPVDFTEEQHTKTYDRYFTLHLDAERNILCAPIKVNVNDPIHGFRDSIGSYPLVGEVDPRLQQISDKFTTWVALNRNTQEEVVVQPD